MIKPKNLEHPNCRQFSQFLIKNSGNLEEWRAQKDSLGTLCLWGIRDDLVARCLPNLLIVEPSGRVRISVVTNSKNKNTTQGDVFIFILARPEGL